MTGALSASPGLYSVIRLPCASKRLWWLRPKPCPVSCDDASPTRFGSPLARLPGKTKTVLEKLLWNPPIHATPPAGKPSQLLLPPITTCSVSRSLRLPGSTVVTLTLNGENFSDTRDQIWLMLASSCGEKFDVSVSMLY